MSVTSELCPILHISLASVLVYHTQKSATAKLIHINKKHCEASKISSHVLNNCPPYQKVFHSKAVYLDYICIVCYVKNFVVSEMFFRKRKILMWSSCKAHITSGQYRLQYSYKIWGSHDGTDKIQVILYITESCTRRLKFLTSVHLTVFSVEPKCQI